MSCASDCLQRLVGLAKQRYGAPRLTNELHAQGLPFNIKMVADSLRRQGLRAKAARKFSPVSYREHGMPVSENLLKQDFALATQIKR
ncbi:Mobile element protein [Dickeya solani RNS 08.23.3.1.A]|nr:Mobile element protein [Dickeya solani RNS 08.23.3.1.A]